MDIMGAFARPSINDSARPVICVILDVIFMQVYMTRNGGLLQRLPRSMLLPVFMKTTRELLETTVLRDEVQSQH